ncbi:acyl-CoA dehydrogenase family protein [Brevundimonas naejangsanensis]|uniref:acyl-CoA dehydrogenase family protein n=1 Tax=Brevundimonas naejangsanensis TaxID=588932 RepID=UPI0032083628
MSGDDSLNDIQAMLRDSLAKVLERHYEFEARQSFRRAAPGYSTDAWDAYAELGLLSLGVAESDGGAGGDLSDLALICGQMGAALTLEPFIPTVVFGGRLIAAAGTEDQKARWLAPVMAGETKVALAHGERGGRYGAQAIQARARREGDGFVLSGEKRVAEGADAADLLMVSALTEDADGQARLALFLVAADAAGVARRGYRAFDGQGAADIVFDDVSLPAEALLGDRVDGRATLEQALDEATTLQCADAVGAMRAANALTQEYARVRKQFGTTIGSFQALQHRMVDMAVAEEMAAAITGAAVSAVEAPEATRARAVSAAKVRVGESARLIGQQAVQLHGGMGLTEEYPAAHFFARLGLFERRWGDADHHLNRFSALMDVV